jgi:hypothetical protein
VHYVSILLDKIVKILAINHESSVAINERRFGPKNAKVAKKVYATRQLALPLNLNILPPVNFK